MEFELDARPSSMDVREAASSCHSNRQNRIMNTSLLSLLSRNWWVLLLRGIAAVVFGVLAWFWPGVTLITLVLLYGVYAATDGILALVAAIKGGTVAPRWWLVLAGLFGLAAAAVTFLYPGL